MDIAPDILTTSAKCGGPRLAFVVSPSARALSLLAAATLAALVLSGCSSKPEGGPDGGSPDAGPPGSGGAAGLPPLNVTSPHPGGPSYTRDYSGLAKEEPAALQGLPTGPSRGPFQSCCAYSWVDAADLFADGQMSAVRVRLDWTNTQQDQGNLDVAVCVPWLCGFPEMPDQTDQQGPHSETFDFVSGGHRQFTEQGLPYQVGVRYSNLVAASGVPFTLHVEVVPVADALAFVDPYEVEVPAGATLLMEMASPFRQQTTAEVMVYGEDDRPLAYRTVDGATGARAPLVEGPGKFVVVPFAYAGSLVRLVVENATAPPPGARLLQETFGTVVVATVADPAPRQGTFAFEAPPGSIDPFPFFLYDGASVQVPGAAGAGAISLASSSGVVADVDLAALGAVTPAGQMCLTCSVDVVGWSPQNYVDDDGTYQVAYDSSQATGTFVLFTATYSR